MVRMLLALKVVWTAAELAAVALAAVALAAVALPAVALPLFASQEPAETIQQLCLQAALHLHQAWRPLPAVRSGSQAAMGEE